MHMHVYMRRGIHGGVRLRDTCVGQGGVGGWGKTLISSHIARITPPGRTSPFELTSTVKAQESKLAQRKVIRSLEETAGNAEMEEDVAVNNGRQM